MELEEIKKLPIVGNYYNDAHIFKKLDAIIADTTRPIEERLAAIKHLDVAMRHDLPYPTEADLNEYMIVGGHVFAYQK
jgi:hypothetical protein